MAASSIPNLNTLRSRTGIRGRSRGGLGRGRPDPVTPDASINSSKDDAAVQRTDNDAVSARWSAVNLGYLDDAYIDQLILRDPPAKRYPIINRGTYVRTKAIDILIERFLDAALSIDPTRDAQHNSVKVQVVSLGAGSDTRPFRLLAKYRSRGLVYHETDFETNTRDKISAIRSSEILQRSVGLRDHEQTDLKLESSEISLSSMSYHIHALDLRDLAALPSSLALDKHVPTLVLSECCLCYLDADTSSTITQSIISSLNPTTPSALLLYEPIRPHDAFGQTMVSNLASRGIHMPSLAKYPDLDAQKQRMHDVGFDYGQAVDIDTIYYSDQARDHTTWISDDERARVEGLEWLDEVEEWRLLGSHYCVAWGWRGGDENVFGRAWTGIGDS